MACLAGAPAAAQALDLSRVGCAQVSTSAIARQPWRPGGTPFGLPYSSWRRADFADLKGRIQQCGGDPAYVAHLEELHPTASGNTRVPLARSVASDLRRRIQTLPSDPEAALRTLDQLSLEVRAAGLPENEQAALEAVMENMRMGVEPRMRQKRLEEAQARLAPKLEAMVAAAKATPATRAGLTTLHRLYADIEPATRGFSFFQRESYRVALQGRLEEVRNQLTHERCAAIVATRGLSPGQALLPIFGEGESMGDLVCHTAVATGQGHYRAYGAARDGRFAVSTDRARLIFQLGRAVIGAGAFYPPASPVQRGEPAFRLEGVVQDGRVVPLPTGSLLLLQNAHLAAWSEFLRDIH